MITYPNRAKLPSRTPPPRPSVPSSILFPQRPRLLPLPPSLARSSSLRVLSISPVRHIYRLENEGRRDPFSCVWSDAGGKWDQICEFSGVGMGKSAWIIRRVGFFACLEPREGVEPPLSDYKTAVLPLEPPWPWSGEGDLNPQPGHYECLALTDCAISRVSRHLLRFSWRRGRDLNPHFHAETGFQDRGDTVYAYLSMLGCPERSRTNPC